jgi:phosphatidylserine/phosphatidylglycerophosphate/cardiolipin synthase-like enzyme
MRAKVVIVDGDEAYILGSPFKKDYWDSHQHIIHDPRRKDGQIRPVHDISIKLKGGSVEHIEEFFIQMWNYISKEEYHGNSMLSLNKKDLNNKPRRSKVPIQIARTITRDTLNKKEELGIFEGYRKAIAKAEDYIYFECQYFTNIDIIKALKNAMKANKDLQVIVVMNENPIIPTYKKWQNQCLEKLGIKSVEDNLNHPQISFYTLWSSLLNKKIITIQPLYVHTKLAIIDDIWATLGTANIDGSSLTHVNELKGFFDNKFHRNMEINVKIPILENRKIDDVKMLRINLWKEHLGDNLIDKPDNGWLEYWKEIAIQNINSLKRTKPELKSQILPYSPEKDIKKQLEDFNIDTTGWNILESE